MDQKLPRLPAFRMNERITICVEPELKELFDRLRREQRINAAEIVRRVMREELKKASEETQVA